MSKKRTAVRDPKSGTRWFRPASKTGFVLARSAETRHVIDRTLGGAVIFISGRWSRHAYKQQCSLSEWFDWAYDAREVTAK